MPVVFCLDRAGFTDDDGPSHHGVLDMALVTKVPGLTLFAPSSYQEIGPMLHDPPDLCDGPAVIRYPTTAAVSVDPHEVGPGRPGRKVRGGPERCSLSGRKGSHAGTEANKERLG